MTIYHQDRMDRASGNYWIPTDSPAGPWTTRTVTGGGAINVRPAGARQGIGGARWVFSGAAQTAEVGKTLGGLTSAFLSFWVRVTAQAQGGAGSSALLALLRDVTAAKNLCGLSFRDDGAGRICRIVWRDAGANQTDDVTIAAPALGIWTHFQLYVLVNAGAGAVLVYRNSILVAAKAPLDNSDTTADEVAIKGSCSNAANTLTASIDGLRVTSDLVKPIIRRRSKGRRRIYF